MNNLQLKPNQSALLLEADEHGEISINVAAGDINSLPAALCQLIAGKLTDDARFQEELMDMLDME